MPAARGAPAHGSRAEAPVSSTRRSRQAPEMRQEEGEPWEAKEPRARVANAIGAPPTPRRQAPKAAPQRAAEDTVMDTPRDLEGRGSADTQWPLLLGAPWCRGRRRPPRGVWLGERPISSRSPTAAPFLLNPVSEETQTQRPHVPRKVLLGLLWLYLKWPRPWTGIP